SAIRQRPTVGGTPLTRRSSWTDKPSQQKQFPSPPPCRSTPRATELPKTFREPSGDSSPTVPSPATPPRTRPAKFATPSTNRPRPARAGRRRRAFVLHVPENPPTAADIRTSPAQSIPPE